MNGLNPWRWHEDLRLLFFAMLLSIAAMTAVSFFSEAVKNSFTRHAADLLAADLRISADRAFDSAWQQKAQSLQLDFAEVIQMPTMAVNKNQDMTLVSLKAVGRHYPLRGKLQISTDIQQVQGFDARAPGLQKAFIDKKLAIKHKIFVGEKITLGYQQFLVAAYIINEPDKVGGLFELAPRVLINRQDMEKTGLIVDGSRVHYRFLVSGAASSVQQFQLWSKQHCSACKMETVKNARPEIRDSLDKAGDFLQLAALVAMMLSAAAMVMASRQYSIKQQQHAAIMRSLGASLSLVNFYMFRELGALLLYAALVGTVVGYVASLYLQYLMGIQIQMNPALWWRPALSGLLLAVLMVPGLLLPLLLSLKNVPPLGILKKQTHTFGLAGWLLVPLVLLALLLVLLWNSEDGAMTALFYMVLLASLLLVYVLAWLAAVMLARIRRVTQGSQSGWNMGLIMFVQRKYSNGLQITALAAGVLVMVLLSLIHKDILSLWQQSFDRETANTFLINVQQQDIEPLSGQLAQMGVQARFFPMVRGRLIAVNGKAITMSDYSSFRARRLLSRALNLSWSGQLPRGNRLQAGQWWHKGSMPQGLPQISVEQGFAKTLGLKMGDKVDFSLAGETIRAQISSIRSLKWQTMQINFFVLFQPGVLEQYPQTWVSSFHLPQDKQQAMQQFLQSYPYITQLEVGEIIRQVQAIMDQLVVALRFVFFFTLGGALLVLMASAAASRPMRRREIALQKVLGAQRKQLWQSLLAEYALIAFFAVIPAAIAALWFANYLAIQFFSLPSQINLHSLLVVVPAAFVVILASGWFANGRVMNTLPVNALK